MVETAQKCRADKWLWHARFFKTRSLATKLVKGGHLRINGVHASKASAQIAVGDTLVFAQGSRIRVVEIAAIGTRRGPAPEAQTLYHDLTPVPDTVPESPQIQRMGRPSKKDRRMARLLRGSYLE
ncbi:MAG: RNA-binding protein S4 [Rhodobacterales bacterium]|nr:MAG: RNA-binding protein S4 [Rhodobacterales bacterium]